jgi:hypothetical protein
MERLRAREMEAEREPTGRRGREGRGEGFKREDRYCLRV